MHEGVAAKRSAENDLFAIEIRRSNHVSVEEFMDRGALSREEVAKFDLLRFFCVETLEVDYLRAVFISSKDPLTGSKFGEPLDVVAKPFMGKKLALVVIEALD